MWKKIILIIAILILLFPFFYVQINKQLFKQRVLTYLIEEKHYKKTDILSIEGIWGKKLPAFYVDVVFQNEPTIRYTYFAHGSVRQFSYETLDDRIIDKEQLLNYEEPNYKYELK